jgi:hypothetical protein
MGTGVLVRVERGEVFDVIELIDDAGNVLLAHAHGIHDNERLRTREALLRLLRAQLAPGVAAAVTRGAGK